MLAKNGLMYFHRAVIVTKKFVLAFLVASSFLFGPDGAAQPISPSQRCSQQCGDAYARCIAAKGLPPKSFNPVCADGQNRCRQGCPKGGSPGVAGKAATQNGSISRQRCQLHCKNTYSKCYLASSPNGKLTRLEVGQGRGLCRKENDTCLQRCA